MKTLEKELEQAIAKHKYAVVKAKMIDYYTTLEMGQVNLPNFLRKDTPEKKADKDLKDILYSENGIKKFNELYEIAWKSIAEFVE